VSELAELRGEIHKLREEVRELRRIIVGNGGHDTSVLGRLLTLEVRAGSGITWQWVVDKFIVGVAVGLAVYFASR
jgi:hypothetical protein